MYRTILQSRSICRFFAAGRQVALRRGAKVTAPPADARDGFFCLILVRDLPVRGGEKLSITPNEYKLLKALTQECEIFITRQAFVGTAVDLVMVISLMTTHLL